MAITKFLARDLKIEVDTGGSGGGYVEIKGLDSITHAPTSVDAPTSDFNSHGRAEHLKAERGDQWTCTGFTLEDVVTGERDPGQEFVEDIAQRVGPAAQVNFRVTSPGGNTITFGGTATVTLAGGATNVAATWQAVILASGPITFSPA